ncbi:hypothetical protein C6P45_004481 [Maudiozyma exigua]|uniref:Transcription factor IIIC putative zinc-finger domain-containing protein n=1 Tax=Maudiozyma exigua TaxID=34358 RepID=A0A9P6WCM0_MAUEX|nr:hypothetical protein C6P45_004481 [Kazachstania exigua]
MKLLKDLLLQRKDLINWDNGFTWSRNGRLYFRTTPELVIGEPIYQASELINNNAKGLFRNVECPLAVENVMEWEEATNNPILNSQPASIVRSCKPSRVGDSEYLAVITNNFNISICKDKQIIVSIDVPDQKDVRARAFHSFEWSPIDNVIVVGNELGELLFFSKEQITDNFVLVNTIKIDELAEQSITRILWGDGHIIITASDNSIWKIDTDYLTNNSAVKLFETGRFGIFDLTLINSRYVTVTATGHIFKYDLTTNDLVYERLPVINNFYIIPIRDSSSVIIVSNNSVTIKINLNSPKLHFEPDTTIGPELSHKFKKWNDAWNESGKYETSLNVYGTSLSPDGYSVAVLYDIARISYNYIIPSQRQYRVMFIPLCEQWTISNEANGLAWYQTHMIYQRAGLSMRSVSNDNSSLDSIDNEFDINIPFKEYLNEIFKNEKLNLLKFNVYLDQTDSRRMDIFRKLIMNYALAKIDTITNTLDIASLIMLAKNLGITDSKIPQLENKEFTMKGDFITQSFHISDDTITDEIASKEGNIWKRCSVSLLPLLSIGVKRCPVTNHRVIDIERDSLNEYGWFTKTLLEVCHKNSVYTGNLMV